MHVLREAFPVASMRVEDISQVLARLEKAGFDLEIDPSLLIPESKDAPKSAASVAKLEDHESSERMHEGGQRPASLRVSTKQSSMKSSLERYSTSSSLASMLPWIVGFAVVLLVAFAAFAF